jgi:hypothetical protein
VAALAELAVGHEQTIRMLLGSIPTPISRNLSARLEGAGKSLRAGDEKVGYDKF